MTKETMTNTPLPAGAIRAANAVDDCFGAIESGICKPEHIAAIIHNSGPKEMVEALQALRKSVVSLVWEPMGSTGDESDWFQCQLCGARTRGSSGHDKQCPMSQAERALNRYLKGE